MTYGTGMKKWIFFALALFSSSASAQLLTYRAGDPFVFCTYGQINPLRCWMPISAAAGTVWTDPTCDPPNAPYGRPWTQDDYLSLEEWYAICPGVGQGIWMGPGTGQEAPAPH